MKVSCNGCRVLRKGCSDDCTIRPCLQWIGSPEAQANATLFLAKFYGRAGLVNLLGAGPVHLRPAMFRSLLYEACGRIVYPIYGSVGLLSSRNWLICQAAVNAVLHGKPIGQIASAAAAVPARACVNHHVGMSTDAKLHKVPKPRSRFKRSSANTRPKAFLSPIVEELQQQGPPAGSSANGENQKNGSVFDVEKAEGSRGSQTDLNRKTVHGSTAKDVGLDLTLGLRSARTIPFESKVSGPSTISSVDPQFSF